MKHQPQILLRIQEVLNKTGKSRSAMYRDVAAGLFPASIRIGDSAVAWLESDVEKWIDARVAESKAAA